MHDERMQTSSKVLRRRALVRDERVVARDAQKLAVVPFAVVGAQGRELPLERALDVSFAREALHVKFTVERVKGVVGRLPTPLDALRFGILVLVQLGGGGERTLGSVRDEPLPHAFRLLRRARDGERAAMQRLGGQDEVGVQRGVRGQRPLDEDTCEAVAHALVHEARAEHRFGRQIAHGGRGDARTRWPAAKHEALDARDEAGCELVFDASVVQQGAHALVLCHGRAVALIHRLAQHLGVDVAHDQLRVGALCRIVLDDVLQRVERLGGLNGLPQHVAPRERVQERQRQLAHLDVAVHVVGRVRGCVVGRGRQSHLRRRCRPPPNEAARHRLDRRDQAAHAGVKMLLAAGCFTIVARQINVLLAAQLAKEERLPCRLREALRLHDHRDDLGDPLERAARQVELEARIVVVSLAAQASSLFHVRLGQEDDHARRLRNAVGHLPAHVVGALLHIDEAWCQALLGKGRLDGPDALYVVALELVAGAVVRKVGAVLALRRGRDCVAACLSVGCAGHADRIRCGRNDPRAVEEPHEGVDEVAVAHAPSRRLVVLRHRGEDLQGTLAQLGVACAAQRLHCLGNHTRLECDARAVGRLTRDAEQL